MNRFSLNGLAIVIVLFSLTANAGKASVDLSGLDEEARALLAKERARQMMFKSEGEKQQSESGRASSGGSSTNSPKRLDDSQAIVKKGGVTGGCNIDIGNNEGGRPGSGLSKPKAVIITGPVIQQCK